MFTRVVAYKNQRYDELKKSALTSGEAFRDPLFPPTLRSLSLPPQKAKGIIWKRPKDICDNPQFIVDGVKDTDFIQGELGNCWLVAACSCLTVNMSFWTQVVVNYKEQELNIKSNSGIFHFRFWRFGEWIDVVVDDLLPTRNGKLVFCHSSSPNEFWPALLEKAYAKLYESYAGMDIGELSEALEDFTGGVTESFELEDQHLSTNPAKRSDFFVWAQQLFESNSLLCAAIPAKNQDEMEARLELGLIKGHAYAVTAIERLSLGNRDNFIEMIKLRNPWGAGYEWQGSFCDGSSEWDSIPASEKKRIKWNASDDGDFWMTFKDFCSFFVRLAVCSPMNTGRTLFGAGKRWKETLLNGDWVLPHRVGGCINYRKTFLDNPQYLIEVTKSDEVVIELSQKMLRQPGTPRETIGFTIMQVEENRNYRLHVIMPIVVSSAFLNGRSVLVRQTFGSGRYVLVACTFEPGVLGSFLLRCYSGSTTSVKELVFDSPVADKSSLLPYRKPECVTQVQICGLTGLQRSNYAGVLFSCVISCEGEQVKSPVYPGTTTEWNVYAVFYRREPLTKPVTVDVYQLTSYGNTEFIGSQVFVAARDVTAQPIELPLVGRDGGMLSVKLRVVITTSRNLLAV